MSKKVATSSMPPWIPRLVVTIAISVIAIGVSIFLLWKLASFISWVLIALFLSFALEPLVNGLVARGWRRRAATGAVLLSFVLVLGVVVGAMVPLVIEQINGIVQVAPGWLTSSTNTINGWFGTSISQDSIVDQFQSADALIANYATNVAGNVLGLSRQIFVGLLQVLTIGLFTFYLVADAHKVRRFVCSFLPAKKQKIVLRTWEIAIDKTGAYLYSRALLGIISAVISFIVLVLLGVPFALPLALWMGLVSQFLPVIGTYIAASVPLVVALIHDPVEALILLIFIIIYQQVENYYFGPKITAHTMELHPAVAFGAVLVGASVAGVVGALLALPIAAIAQEGVQAYSNSKRRYDLVESKMLKRPERNAQKPKKA